DIELLAVDAAILVDPGEGVDHRLPIGRADVRRAAGEILKMADRDLGLRARRCAADRKYKRNRAQKGFCRHGCFPPAILCSHSNRSFAKLNVKTGRASSRS